MGKLVLGAVIFITAAVIVFLVSMIWISAAHMPSQTAPPAKPAATESTIMPSGLAIPVAGIRPGQLADTFTQARAGGRPHDAIDIMAPRGTTVVAAADGILEKLYFSRGGGGITAYVRSPDRQWIYYYAHLDGYAPGPARGPAAPPRRSDRHRRQHRQRQCRRPAPPFRRSISWPPSDRWWQGRAINPYPVLAGRASRR